VDRSRNAAGFIKLLSLPNRSSATPTPNSPEQVRLPFQNSYGFNKDAKVLRYEDNNREARDFVKTFSRDRKLESLPFGRYFVKKK